MNAPSSRLIKVPINQKKKSPNLNNVTKFLLGIMCIGPIILSFEWYTSSQIEFKPSSLLAAYWPRSDYHANSKCVDIDIDTIAIPGFNMNKTIYVMNTMFLPYSNMISIHLVSRRWWHSREKGFQHNNVIQNWLNYSQSRNVSLHCLFPHGSSCLSSDIEIVPEVLFSPHKLSTQTLLCKIPNEIKRIHEKELYEFIFATSDHSIVVGLHYNVIKRSIFPYQTNYNFDEKKHKNKRFVSVCMGRIADPLPYITETVAYYISQGIEHIYIGTYFTNKLKEKHTNKLIDLLKPWYDLGQITLMNFVMPYPIIISANLWGQPQFTIQCLYLAKAFGDQFTLNIDADEFVVFHNNISISNNLRYKYYNDIKDKCWTVFDSFSVWKLTKPNSSFLSERYTEIDATQKYLQITCKSLWNNKVLWSAEVHSGGACNINNTFGFSWNEMVFNYKQYFRKYKTDNPQKLIRVMNAEYEASIRHFVNAIKVRSIFVPLSNTIDDSCALNQIINHNIKSEFNRKLWRNPTFYNNNNNIKSEFDFDVLHSKDYTKIYGRNKAMDDSKIDPNLKFNITKRYKSLTELIIPRYESLNCSKKINKVKKRFKSLKKQRIIIDYRHRLVYCYIPKTGCTKFKALFYSVINDIYPSRTSNLSLEYEWLHNEMYKEKYTKYSNLWDFYDNPLWKSLIVIRDPLERLLSAFLDKCLSEKIWWGCAGTVTSNFTEFALRIHGLWEKNRNINDHSSHQYKLCNLNSLYPKYIDYVIVYNKSNIAAQTLRYLTDVGLESYYYKWGIYGNQTMFQTSTAHKTRGIESDCEFYSNYYDKKLAQLMLLVYKKDYEFFNLTKPYWIQCMKQ